MASKTDNEALQDAADRVRAARTMAALRQDEESVRELTDAMKAFDVLNQEEAP
jgi:hypothetical protein